MALPLRSLGREPPGGCSEGSWSPALLWGKLLSSGPNRDKYSWSVAPKWKIKCVETLCSPLGISAKGREGPPARPWHTAKCSQGSRDNKTAHGLAVPFAPRCWHLVHTWEATASLPCHLDSTSQGLGLLHCGVVGAPGLYISQRGVVQGTHCSGREPLCLLPSDEHLPSLELHFVVHCFLNAIYFGNALRGKPRAQSQPLCRVAAAT